MAVTYTENLHLGMQLDKNDYLDWDAITENWRKIDAAYSGGGNMVVPGTARAAYNSRFYLNTGITALVGDGEGEAHYVSLV